VTILDVNILLYSYSRAAPEHARVREWLEGVFASSEWVGLTWVTLWAFLRIATNPRLTGPTAPVDEAFRTIHTLLTLPRVLLIEPGPSHPRILERLMHEQGAVGPRVTGAVLAAIAIENGAVLASTDRDFRRFSGLRWINPLERG
jgi:toxin-antitoxin system PIN domain toxin